MLPLPPARSMTGWFQTPILSLRTASLPAQAIEHFNTGVSYSSGVQVYAPVCTVYAIFFICAFGTLILTMFLLHLSSYYLALHPIEGQSIFVLLSQETVALQNIQGILRQRLNRICSSKDAFKDLRPPRWLVKVYHSIFLLKKATMG